jgi:hypothetical protein
MPFIAIELKGIDAVQRQLQRLAGPEMERATTMAINKVAAKAQTEADRAIRERFVIPRDQVRGSMVLIRARRGRMAIEAVLQIFGSPTRRGRSMNLVRFMERSVTLAQHRKRAKQGDKQLHFKILRRSGLKTISGAFLGNKGRTVFRRTGDERLPIEPVQVVGVGQMFNTRAIRERVLLRINRELEVEIGRAVELAISRR